MPKCLLTPQTAWRTALLTACAQLSAFAANSVCMPKCLLAPQTAWQLPAQLLARGQTVCGNCKEKEALREAIKDEICGRQSETIREELSLAIGPRQSR